MVSIATFYCSSIYFVNYIATLNPSGMDIRARTIEVSTGGSIITLTGVDGPGTYDG